MSTTEENQNETSTETGTSSAESTQTSETQTTDQSSQGTTQEGQSSSTLADALKEDTDESGQSNEQGTDEQSAAASSGEEDTSSTGDAADTSEQTQTSEGYEIEVAPDSPISDDDLDQIVKMAEENNWTKEQADAAIKQYEDYYNRGVEKASEPWNQYYSEQQQRFDKDPEFNGDNKAKTFMRIRAAVTKFAGEDMIKQLSRPEIGNNYELAKFLAKIGAQLEGDSPELFGKGASGAETTDDPETARMKSMYPGFFK